MAFAGRINDQPFGCQLAGSECQAGATVMSTGLVSCERATAAGNQRIRSQSDACFFRQRGLPCCCPVALQLNLREGAHQSQLSQFSSLGSPIRPKVLIDVAQRFLLIRTCFPVQPAKFSAKEQTYNFLRKAIELPFVSLGNNDNAGSGTHDHKDCRSHSRDGADALERGSREHCSSKSSLSSCLRTRLQM